MLHGTKDTSNSGDSSKKKKKYLYLERFEQYQLSMKLWMLKTDARIKWLTVILVAEAIALVGIVLWITVW